MNIIRFIIFLVVVILVVEVIRYTEQKKETLSTLSTNLMLNLLLSVDLVYSIPSTLHLVRMQIRIRIKFPISYASLFILIKGNSDVCIELILIAFVNFGPN